MCILISSLFFVGPATVISSSVVQAPANFPAKITSRTQINTAGDFPVFHYKLKLRSAQDWAGFVKAAAAESESVGAGCRVYLTLPRPADVTMTRPYVFAVFVWFWGGFLLSVLGICPTVTLCFQVHVDSCRYTRANGVTVGSSSSGGAFYGDGLFSLPQVEFAIKHYAQGAFTSQLAVLPVGTPVLKSNRFLVLR